MLYSVYVLMHVYICVYCACVSAYYHVYICICADAQYSVLVIINYVLMLLFSMCKFVHSFSSKIRHYLIKFKDSMYTIDGISIFENLTQMVEHYQKDANGLVTRLQVPVAKEGKQKYLVEMDDFKKCEE